MINQLVQYENARRALAEARTVDEVKHIHDKSMAMKLYATQAKDPALINHAIEIKMRAEIKIGEMLIEMAQRGERHCKVNNLNHSKPAMPLPTLADLGISKHQSYCWQNMAKLSEPEREDLIKVIQLNTTAPTDISDTDQKKEYPRPSRSDYFRTLTRAWLRASSEERHKFLDFIDASFNEIERARGCDDARLPDAGLSRDRLLVRR